MSIKFKVLLLSIIGPTLLAITIFFNAVQNIWTSEEQAVIHSAKGIVSMAESARNEMAMKFDGVIRPFGEIPRDKLIDAVPIITAIKMARQNAEKLGYKFRVPKFSPRNPANEPNALEKTALEQITSKGLPELIVRQKDAIHYFKPIVLTAECMFCHGDPKGTTDPIGGIKEGWKAGEIHGAFEIIYSLDEAVAKTKAAAVSVGIATAAILVFIICAVWLIMRNSLVAPLVRLQQFARQVSEGELDTQPRGTFKAELQALEQALTAMVVRLKEKISFSEQKTAEAKAAEARAQQHADEAAEARDDALKSRAQGMTEAANMLEGVINSVTSASQEISAQVEQSSNFAASQASSMNAVAAAMEEMNSSITAVSDNATQASASSEIIKVNANKELKEVNVMVDAIKSVQTMADALKSGMSELGHQAEDIGKIMNVINDIADQTNLLALNAAIEAARAGDAGRGFAVVADEVRKLAEKTMASTNDVGNAIAAIQGSAGQSVQAMDKALAEVETAADLAKQSGEALQEIVTKVEASADQVSAIAAASEQQSATSDEITRSIERVNEMSGQTAQAMGEASRAVNELARQAERMGKLIGEMKRG